MFNLRNWKYTTHKSIIHALIGAAGFVLIMLPIFYYEIQADGQEPVVDEHVIEAENGAELSVNVPVPVRGAGGVAAIDEATYRQDSVSGEAALAEQAFLNLQEHEFIVRKEEVYYETLDFDTEYVDNLVWTSDREELLQEGETGELQVTVLVTYRGLVEEQRTVLSETVIKEPVPMIIERGTKAPAEYIMPMDEGRFTSGFGMRWGRMHSGLDFGVSIGTRVNAARDGVVTLADEVGSYGNVVFISHENGEETRYAHLSEWLVEPGQEVKQGDQIALSGNTGRSTGPHLHFEIRVDGEAINPWDRLDN